MTSLDECLSELAGGGEWQANWADVLGRARRRRLPVLIAAAAAVAVLVPLVAVSAVNDWWFFASGAAPAPTHAPIVVRKGDWGGHRWELVAYPAADAGLCLSMNPLDTKGSYGAALECGPHPRITYLAGSPTAVLPGYVAGPVVASARRVRITFSTGGSLTVPTFPAPPPLDRYRFYVARLGAPLFPRSRRRPFPGPVTSLAGLDAHGNVVACLVPAHARDGISPLRACR